MNRPTASGQPAGYAFSHYLSSPRVAGFALATLAGALLLGGCKGSEAPQAVQAEAPPVEVNVIELQAQPLTLTRELPGRTNAYRVAQIRARVNGIVEKRLFEEGAEVKQGDVLYEIDAAPYEATLASAKASLARAEANLSSAKLQADRYKELVARKAVSQQEYDNAVSAMKAFEADIAAANAAVITAEIDLGYTRVTAPISGRIGRSEVTEGAYVQAGAATLLATIHQLDPIYVDVSQSNDQLLRLRRDIAAGRVQEQGDGEVGVVLVLDDGSSYDKDGKLQFSEVRVDEGTGTVTMRALFPNPERLLLPGMFVRARVPEALQPQAVVAPQSAVSRNTRGEPFAYVVNDKGEAELRELQLDRAVGHNWLITSGLNAGDKLVVEGRQSLRPGVKVNATTVDNASAKPNKAR